MSVSNIDKLLQYLKCVAVQPIKYYGKLDRDSGIQTYDDSGNLITIVGSTTPIQSIKLNDSFFHTDSCLNCGGCDPAESNTFTQSEYDRIMEADPSLFKDYGLDPEALQILKTSLVEHIHIINGKRVSTYSYKQVKNFMYLPVRGRELDRCSWCFQDSFCKFKCRIHPVTSITCKMPHLRFYHLNNSKNTSMGIYQFGRNWALKCPVKFFPPTSEEEFEINKGNRIEKLKQLEQVSQDLNIQTYLPQVISYVEEIQFDDYTEHLNKNILPPQRKNIRLF